MFNALKFCIAMTLAFPSCVALSEVWAQDAPSNGGLVTSDTAIESITPLARAIISGDAEQVGKLLEAVPKGADVLNERVRAKPGSRAGFTPLLLAAALSDWTIANMLVQRGADVTLLDDYHRSAFWYAALRDDVAITKGLGEIPAARGIVNQADSDFKRTPLHIAVRGNDAEVVILLLRAGASGTERDILRETPHDYCKRNFTAACKGLL